MTLTLTLQTFVWLDQLVLIDFSFEEFLVLLMNENAHVVECVLNAPWLLVTLPLRF